MHIVYEGVELEMLELTDFVQEAVYDDTKTDWLYDRFYIEGRFLVNGQADANVFTPVTSYAEDPDSFEKLSELWRRTAPDGAGAALPIGGGPTGLNNATYGNVRSEFGPFLKANGDGIYATSTGNQLVPFVVKRMVPTVNTAVVIRKRLLNPRGRLFVFTGRGDVGRKDEMLLMSPSRFGDHTDCKNGPIPQFARVSAFHGDAQTFVVDWAVETFVKETSSLISNETPNAFNEQTSDSILLSNRFKCRHVLDEDSYLTIETEGTALFRTDFLFKDPPLNPDQLRLNVCLPVPFGMIREVVDIDPIADGTGYHYRLVDKQQHANFVAGPYANATHIEAVHRQAISMDEDTLSGALHAYERVYSLRANRAAAENRSSSRPASPPPPPPRGARPLGGRP